MAEWNREKVNSSDLNNGNEYDKDSQVALQELNGMVNAGLYAQDFAEHLADTPDISEINGTGTASVSFVDNPSATTNKPYKRFKFSNLKGSKGDKGDKGDTGAGSNPNLLINSDFSINQRGQEEYGNATQYTVDRWQITTRTNANISFNATTKTLSNTGTTRGYFIQRLEPNDVDKIWGKTWTFSAKVNGNIYSRTFTAPSSAPTSSQDIAPTLVCVPNVCNVRLFYYSNNNSIGFTFDIYTGSVTLEYAKLEVGSVATPFSPRPYAEELALCQRYYQVLGIDSVAYSTYGAVSYENKEYYAANTPIPLISIMRTTPTVKIITMPYIRNYNNLNSIAFRMNQIILFRNNEIQLQFLADGVEPGAIYVSYAGLVSLDAELY